LRRGKRMHDQSAPAKIGGNLKRWRVKKKGVSARLPQIESDKSRQKLSTSPPEESEAKGP